MFLNECTISQSVVEVTAPILEIALRKLRFSLYTMIRHAVDGFHWQTCIYLSRRYLIQTCCRLFTDKNLWMQMLRIIHIPRLPSSHTHTHWRTHTHIMYTRLQRDARARPHFEDKLISLLVRLDLQNTHSYNPLFTHILHPTIGSFVISSLHALIDRQFDIEKDTRPHL